jgi:predicted XRE-type DNA-binding protein
MSNEQRFSDVWDAIEDTEVAAASMRARSNLMIALQSWAKASKSTQAEAARLLGITQPRMSDLMRGKINLFSLDSLLDMATLAGLQPQIIVNSVPDEAEEIDMVEEGSFTEKTRASAATGLVHEVRTAGNDGSKFVVATESSGTQATSSESRLTLVKTERAA